MIPSSDGAEVYVFNAHGRHVRTLDAVTGAKRWELSYDDAKRLVAVTDGDGRTMRIERAADGSPVAVVARGGARTTLTLDGAGRAVGIENPAGGATELGYGDDGLLSTFALPGRPPAKFDYDADGRLVRDESPTGAVQTLARTQTSLSTTVKVTSGEGRVTTYVAEVLPSGDRRRAIVQPSGATVELVVKPDGSRVKTDPDGTTTTTTFERGGDTVTTDSDGHATTQGPFALTRFGPGGRVSALGDGTLAATLGYDSLGRLNKRAMSAGGSVRYSNDVSYGAAGQVESRTEKAGAATRTLAYDANGRLVKVREGGAVVDAYDYDANGNRIHRTLGGGPQETSAYDAQDRITQRGATNYDVDADGFLSVRGGATFDYSPSGALLTAQRGRSDDRLRLRRARPPRRAHGRRRHDPVSLRQPRQPVPPYRDALAGRPADDVLPRRGGHALRVRARRRPLLRRRRPGRLAARGVQGRRDDREGDRLRRLRRRDVRLRPVVRAADRLRRRARRPRDGPGALRAARLRPGERPLHGARSDLLVGQPDQPPRVRQLRPRQPARPDRHVVRRRLVLRRPRRRHPVLPQGRQVLDLRRGRRRRRRRRGDRPVRRRRRHRDDDAGRADREVGPRLRDDRRRAGPRLLQREGLAEGRHRDRSRRRDRHRRRCLRHVRRQRPG